MVCHRGRLRRRAPQVRPTRPVYRGRLESVALIGVTSDENGHIVARWMRVSRLVVVEVDGRGELGDARQ